jgi:rhamnose transport system permease protein
VIARRRREIFVAAALGALLVVLALRVPDFFAWPNLRDLGVTRAYVLVAAVGMTLVLLAGQIDISIGSQFAVAGVVAGLLARAGLPVALVVAATIAAGAAMGALNGALVAGLGLPSIVVTLATMVTLRKTVVWGRGGAAVDLPEGFQWLGLGQSAGQALVVAAAAALFLAFAWGMRHLAAGRAVYAAGSDPEAARLAALGPRRVVFGVFVLMGALSAMAAVLSLLQTTRADPASGEGLELQVIAAVVVGGTAVSGGRGTLLGTLAGAALLGTIGTALVFLQVAPSWERAVQGLIILVAVASDALNLRRRRDAGVRLAAR